MSSISMNLVLLLVALKETRQQSDCLKSSGLSEAHPHLRLCQRASHLIHPHKLSVAVFVFMEDNPTEVEQPDPCSTLVWPI